MRYPKSFVDSIKNTLPLSQVVRQKTRLEKQGNYFKALCQFHDDKKPSMVVNDEKGMYHCFSCGAHGDIFSFVQETEKLTFTQAIEYLANQAGVALPQLTPETIKRQSKEDKIIEINQLASKYFTDNLYKNKKVQQYLLNRDIDEQLVIKFKIGYALDSWQSLRDFMVKKGYSEKDLIEADLIVNKQGKVYDRFRDRIIFPIFSSAGKIIAFGGRVVDKGEPKYLNSSETPVFKKSSTIYGLNFARNSIFREDTAIVLEGYTDVIALHKAGFTNAVAPLGTAFTVTHLEKLWQICEQPIICLDGDLAGLKAMQRISDIALQNYQSGKSIKFAILPQGQDPDDYIRDNGAEKFREKIKTSIILSDFILYGCINNINPTHPEEIIKAEKYLQDKAELIKDPTNSNQFYYYLKGKLKDYLYKKRQKSFKKSLKSLGANFAENKNELENLEVIILGFILFNPEYLDDSVIHDFIIGSDFGDKKTENLRQKILQAITSSYDYDVKEFDNILAEYQQLYANRYKKFYKNTMSEIFIKDEILNSLNNNIKNYIATKASIDINLLKLDENTDFAEKYEILKEARNKKNNLSDI